MALESVLSFFSRAHRIHIENCNFVASAQPHHVPPLSPPASSVSPPTPSASSRSMDAPSRPASSPIPPVTPVNSEALFIPVAASSVDQPRVKESPFELYGRTLLVAKRGYALWKPKPQGVSLPDAYKQEGARIGDVGFLNEYGGFSYLFNVFRSADDPINLGRVPPDFIPFPIENHHSIEEYLEEFEPGSHVASEPSEISKSNILFPEGQAPIPGVPEDVGAGLTFTSSAIEGAFLILPEGGKRVDYRHWITLYNYTAKCAQAWYKFINGDLDQGGQAMGLREGLYLVTGCDKARAWGAASFNSARPQEKPVHLDFVPKVADRIGGIPGYRFSRCDYAATSSGADVFGTQSGCVFLRGFRIAIRWGTKNPFKLVSEVTFTANMDADEFMRSIHTATHHSSNPELHLVTGDPFPGGSSYDDEASLPERYHVYHPLDGINRWILDNHNEVDIAITHDADWASIVQEFENVMPCESDLIQDLGRRLKIRKAEYCTYACFREDDTTQNNIVNTDSSVTMRLHPTDRGTNTTRFWERSQATYSSESWKEYYRTSEENLKLYSFGQPPDFEALAAPDAFENKRYKFAKRRGDETSSSSSHDSNRRAAVRSRYVTPRASVVSLDSPAASQFDPRPCSQLSQTYVNYYHRGSEGDAEHRHPIELDEGANVETRSEFSRHSSYSCDHGYDASSSRRELHQSWGSSNRSYFSSYAASEEISICSNRRSEDWPSSGGRPSSGMISISSARSTDLSVQEARSPSNDGDSLNWDLLGPPASVLITAIHHDQNLQGTRSPLSDVIAGTSSNQGMLKPATDDFDDSYIFSGLMLSGNAMSFEEGEEPELDFVRKQADEGRLDGEDVTSSSGFDQGRSPGTFNPVRAATTSAAYPGHDGKRSVRSHSDGHPTITGPCSLIPNLETSPSQTPPPLASSSLASSVLENINTSPQTQAQFDITFTDGLNVHSASARTNRRRSIIRRSLGALGSIKSPNNRFSPGPNSSVSPVFSTHNIGPGFDGYRSFKSFLSDEPMESPESMPSSSALKSGPASVYGVSAVSMSPSTAASSRSSSLFPYDELFQKNPNDWGGKEHWRREWVVRKEQKSKDKNRSQVVGEVNRRKEGSQLMQGAGERRNPGEASAEEPDEKIKDAKYRGMPVGTKEIWGNFLLGRFNVTRKDRVSRSAPGGKDVKEPGKEPNEISADVDAAGKRTQTFKRDVSQDVGKVRATHDRSRVDAEAKVEVSAKEATAGAASDASKPPQQRIFIRRLRGETQNYGDDYTHNPSKITSYLTSVLAKQSISIQTINEDTDFLAEQPTFSRDTLASPPLPLASSVTDSEGVVVLASSSSSSRRSPFDSHHPAILVKRHSKAAAFSIIRQYSQDRTGSPRAQRHNVIMLAPRNVQERTVIDRHEAVRTASSPGGFDSMRRKEKGKGRGKGKYGKDDKEEKQSGENLKKDKSRANLSSLKGTQNSSRRVSERDQEVKTQIKSDGQIQLIRSDIEDVRILGSRGKGRKDIPDSDGAGPSAYDVRTRTAPLIHYKPVKYALDGKSKSAVDQDTRYGWNRVKGKRVKVLDDEGRGDEHGSGVRSSRENYKRAYGTLDQPLKSLSSIEAPSTRMESSSSQTHHSILSTASRSSNILKRVLTSISPSTVSSQTDYSASARDITPIQSTNPDISVPYVPPWVTIARQEQELQRGVLGQLKHSLENIGLLSSKKGSEKKSRLYHKKMDVLSCVPTDAYFMLLPLWPAETDAYSQRSSPFRVPSIPFDDRRYLLVFYEPLNSEGLTKGTSSSSTSDLRKILLPGFHAMARQVSHSELESTGVRVPEQGISVNSPLEDAFTHMPRSLAHTLHSSTGDNSSAQLCIIGTSNSRDAGVEFNPEALVELDLCTVLNERRRSLPPGMVVEQLDPKQTMTVELTPVGSAVMEMIWVGGLALMSFES